MKPCSHIYLLTENGLPLEEPIGIREKIKRHNTDFKRQMIWAEVGDVIFGLVLFLWQLFLEWLTFLLWISFILTNLSSSVFSLIYLFIFLHCGASEKPVCSQPCRPCCQMFSSALGGWGPLTHTRRPVTKTPLRWEKPGPCSIFALSHVTFSSQLDFLECSQSWVGTEARFSECYSYASDENGLALFSSVLHPQRFGGPLSSDRLWFVFLLQVALQPWHHLSFPWPPVLSIPCMSGCENMIFSA